MPKGRAQCIVIRNGKFLAAKHRDKNNGKEYYVVPGGRINEGESPEEAAIRELFEEANVKGVIIKKLAEYPNAFSDSKRFYSFLVDIGDQEPSLGFDPESIDDPKLIAIEWKALNEISQRDRMYFFASGLVSIPEFVKEIEKWADDIDYPKTNI